MDCSLDGCDIVTTDGAYYGNYSEDTQKSYGQVLAMAQLAVSAYSSGERLCETPVPMSRSAKTKGCLSEWVVLKMGGLQAGDAL